MITCINCIGQSPDDALFCIECGKPIKANPYVDATKRLTDTIEIDGKIIGPYIPYTGFVEYGTNEFKPKFTVRAANKHGDYFIYKADLGALLKDESTYVKQTEKGYDIYYHGRKVVFMD